MRRYRLYLGVLAVAIAAGLTAAIIEYVGTPERFGVSRMIHVTLQDGSVIDIPPLQGETPETIAHPPFAGGSPAGFCWNRNCRGAVWGPEQRFRISGPSIERAIALGATAAVVAYAGLLFVILPARLLRRD